MLTGQLRGVLLVLVCLNLVFVQITGNVSSYWMLPLFGLTIASPYLWPLQRFLLYRLAWNGALIAIFSLLIVHVQQSGIRFMLEDGLILAAFCQVHVLNNLIKQRRPDLIFFNSFLIALVTGFFCQDVVYSVVFVIYAATLILGIAVAAASTAPRAAPRVLPGVELRAVIGRSMKQGLAALLFTSLVFTFWPRDFDREGFVDDQLVKSSGPSEVAFADQIRLDRKNTAQLTNRIVMRAKLTSGRQDLVPKYWRGATFTTLHRYGWTADTNMQNALNRSRQLDELWRPKGRGEFRRQGHQTGAAIEVELTDAKALNLFVPMQANRIRFTCGAWPTIDGNFRLSRLYHDKIRYSMEFNALGDKPKKARGKPQWDHRELRRRSIPKGSKELEQRVQERIPAGANRRTKVEVIRSFLAEERDYLLPGAPGAAVDLRSFIAGEGGGHCEYFATTMVVLLRLNHVPCRMVSGYLAHEWNEDGSELVVRSNHAHAWVEVWDDETGWFTVDPTPAQNEMATNADSTFAQFKNWLHAAWTAVTSFDSSSRDTAFAWAKEQLLALVALARRNVIMSGTAVLGLILLWRWRRRRRQPRIATEVRDYLGVLARLKLELKPGETPRQLLNRASDEGIPPEALSRLSSATERHEVARYS